MFFKKLSRPDAHAEMQNWHVNEKTFVVSKDDEWIRNQLVDFYTNLDLDASSDYDKDLRFGLRLYSILNSTDNFNLRAASDDGVWMYMSLKVVPDLVSKRWNKNGNAEDHFWKRPGRIWLKQIWWYIHLSWQGTEEITYDILKNNTTDEIQNLVERTGRKGYNVNVYRNIMCIYNQISKDIKQKYKKGSSTLFRQIMVLNTAYSQTIEAGLFEENEKGYAKWLFLSLGIEVQ